jgi:hypothetical protein
MASSGYIRVKGFSTLTRKILNRRILRRIIVVEIPRKYISIAY